MAEESMLDRRMFIKGTVATVALLAAGSLVACSSGSGSDTATDTSTSGGTSAGDSSSSGAASNSSSSGTTSGNASSSDTTSGSASSGNASAAADDPYASGTHHATLVVQDYGTVELELDASVAPITVSNFAGLVNEGFYNGLTFHRIIEGFMAQGGDPKGNGTGGSGTTIKGEFSANGVNNTISFKRGVISMARSKDYDSASSQFFIMQKTNTSIDGQYAAFGHVTSGMDAVDMMCETVPVTDSNGTVAPENQPIITSITMDD